MVGSQIVYASFKFILMICVGSIADAYGLATEINLPAVSEGYAVVGFNCVPVPVAAINKSPVKSFPGCSKLPDCLFPKPNAPVSLQINSNR